jgi:hypothetical protein
MATETTVHAHSYQHFENLQMSAKDFYSMLRDMIVEYQYPDVKCGLTNFKEAGLLSSSREYLRISRGRYNYFVCASPFGKSFFISWWFQEDAHTAANLVEKVPLIGKATAQRMESKTFYQLDTELMFKTAITSIIKTAVNKVMSDKGFRKDTQIDNQ